MASAPDGRERNRDAKSGHKPRPGKGVKADAPQVVERIASVDKPIERVNGALIYKHATLNYTAHREVKATYSVVFEGHEPLKSQTLGGARDLAKAGPPAAVEVPVEASSEPAEAEQMEAVEPIEAQVAQAA